MAKDSGAKKPRIRKSAPTVRERQEAAQAEVEKSANKQPGRLAKAAQSSTKLLRRLHLPKGVKKVFRPFRFLRFLVPRYFINSWREVRQVVWPNRKETWRLTLAVFVFATVFGALVAGVDKGLDEIFKHVVLK